MKTTLYTLALMTLLLGLVASGCYTQVGSTRDDRFSDEYQNDSAVTEEPAATEDTLESTTTDPYFDEYGYPRQRFYLGYSTPVWVDVTYGWYDPWYYRPWYNDIFWCWNPPLAYYSPWWDYSPWYDHHGGWYGGHHSPGGGYATTRTIGSTRGAGGGRGTMGSSRGGYESPGRSGTATQDLPIGARQGSTPTRPRAGAVAPAREREKVKAGRETVRSGSGTRARETARPAQRPRSRGEQTPAPPTYNPPTGSQGGGARTGVSSPPPASRPSGNDGGTRGSGSSRGGGGGRR
jgi:hypothetical protein